MGGLSSIASADMGIILSWQYQWHQFETRDIGAVCKTLYSLIFYPVFINFCLISRVSVNSTWFRKYA